MRYELSYAGLVTVAILSASGALVASSASNAVAQTPTLLGVRSGITGAETRIVLDLSSPADLLVAPGPGGRSFRIVAMAPAAAGAKATSPQGTLERLALGKPQPHTSTLSIGTRMPMALKSVSLLPPEAGAHYRAVFDLGPAEPGDRILLGVPWASSPAIARPDSTSLLRVVLPKQAALEASAFASIADHEGDAGAWLTLARVAHSVGDSSAALVATERARRLASSEANPARVREAQNLSAQILAESTLVPSSVSVAVLPVTRVPGAHQQAVQVAHPPVLPPTPAVKAVSVAASAPQPPLPSAQPAIPTQIAQPVAPQPEIAQAASHPRIFASTLRRQLASANPQIAAIDPRVGVAGAVNPATTGIEPGGGGGQILQIGNDISFHERIVTDTGGQTQILFLDHSAMTVGPNADLTIDEFVYNPETGTGKLAMSATVGVFRYVGGKISKDGNVSIKTPIATIGVRGGIAYINVEQSGRTQATLGFGAQLTVTGISGATQTISKPGYAVTVEVPTQGTAASAAPPPSAPAKAPAASLTTMVQKVEATASNPVNTVLAVTKTTVEERLAPQVTVGSAQPVSITPSSVIAVSPPAAPATAAASLAATPTVSVTQITSTIERSVQAQTVVATEHAVVVASPPPVALSPPPKPVSPPVISPPVSPPVISPPVSPPVVSPPVVSPPVSPPVIPPPVSPPVVVSPPPLPTIPVPTIPSLPTLPSSPPPIVSSPPPPPPVITVPGIPSLPTLPTKPTGP